MLTKSTGRALCDSGDAYGRHWEKNQKKSIDDFQKEPAVSFELPSFKDGEQVTSKEIEYSISVFHYLAKGFDLDSTCNDYNTLACDDWESEIYGVSKAQAEWLSERGFEIGESFNTYNGESSLSQVLQGTLVKQDSRNYVLLQVHQGCDVRGGYTDAKMFYLPNEYMPSEDVFGEIDGVQVDSSYNGRNLTNEQGAGVDVHANSVITLDLAY